MKTTSMKWKGLLVALMAFFTVSLSKAQCPTIDNQLNCPIQVRVYIYLNPCSNSLCGGTPIIVNVPALTSMVVNCPTACQLGICEISMELVQVGGSPVSPIWAKQSVTMCPSGPTTSVPTACGGTATICYNGIDFQVN